LSAALRMMSFKEASLKMPLHNEPPEIWFQRSGKWTRTDARLR
jgi:hypothetical protein